MNDKLEILCVLCGAVCFVYFVVTFRQAQCDTILVPKGFIRTIRLPRVLGGDKKQENVIKNHAKPEQAVNHIISYLNVANIAKIDMKRTEILRLLHSIRNDGLGFNSCNSWQNTTLLPHTPYPYYLSFSILNFQLSIVLFKYICPNQITTP